MKGNRFLTVLLFALVMICASPALAKVKVVVSIYPVGDMVRQVGGDHVTVTVLIPAGASPHTFDPPPSLVRKLASADVFFKIGAGLEMWADKLVAASGNKKLKVITLSDGMELLDAEEHEEHEHGQTANPHIWLDPVLAKEMAAKIAKELQSLDPQNALIYEARKARFTQELGMLDTKIRNSISTFRIKEFVSFHPAFSYFAKRYGLKSIGVIERKPGLNPTPKEIQNIVDSVRKYGIKAVFAEPQFNKEVAEAIAKNAGVKVLIIDPLGGPDTGRDTYIKLLEYDLKILEESMK